MKIATRAVPSHAWMAMSAATFLIAGAVGVAAQERTLQLGYIMAENDPADLAARRFKELVEERTGGELSIVIHPNSLLGGERDLWEGMQIGSVDIAITGVGPISFFTPQYSGVQMYYAVEDVEHLEKVFNGEIGEEIADALLQAQGGRVLDWWHRGPRHITANKPIRTPEDLQGLKLRTPEGKIYLEAWSALGASPTPMALGELFTALEQGVVDGQENPLALIATQSFDEVQSHVSLTAHQVQPYIFAIAENTWQSLSEEQRQIVEEAAKEAGVYEKQLTAESEEDFRAELEEGGMTVVEDVDRDAFKAIMAETAVELENEGLWQEGLYQRIQDAK